MKICLYSGVFFPSIGGIEQVSYTLASYWVEQGHEVTVVTETPAPDEGNLAFSFPVLRSPTLTTWQSVLRTSDIIVSNGHSLRHLSPWLLSRKPIVWIHQSYISHLRSESFKQWRTYARLFLRRATLPLATSHVYISRAIEQHVGSSKGMIIYNPVEDRFQPLPDVAVENDFAFFGRMVSDKGVDTLLEALAICRAEGYSYRVDLYGEGPSQEEWREMAETLGIAAQLRWYPFQRGDALVQAMNRAGAVVVPSRWPEPMGVVAVEAMACGRATIGSHRGGLGEVLDGGGLTFDNGNAQQLAQCLIQVGDNPDFRLSLEKKGYERSRDFATDTIGSKYLQLFEHILNS